MATRISIDDPSGFGRRPPGSGRASRRPRPAAERHRAGHRRPGRAGRRPHHRQPRDRASVPAAPTSAPTRPAIPTSMRTPRATTAAAMNATLARMLANPIDLVRGQPGAETLDTAVSAKAIDAYRKATPTGGGGRTSRSNPQGASDPMNAPFNHARAAHREPFAAYVCDETTAETMRPLAIEHGLVAGEGVPRRPAQRGPAIVGVGQPDGAVRRSVRIGRSAERHQRAGRSLRARHGRAGDRPGQRRAPVPRPDGQRDPGLPAEAAVARHAARVLCAGAGDAERAQAGRPGRRPAALLDRDHRRARRRRRDHARDLAGVDAGRQIGPPDRAARPRRAFRDRRARARPRAGPRPDRCDRKPEPDRRPVHRTRDGEGVGEAGRAVGRSADQFAGPDRRHRFLSVAGRDPRGVRIYDHRPAARRCWCNIRT